MKNLHIKKLFGTIAAGSVDFLIIGTISSWKNFFPFVHFFNLVTICCWGAILYVTWTQSWTQEKLKGYAVALLLTTVPHAFLSALSYGSMVCAVISFLFCGILYYLYKTNKY